MKKVAPDYEKFLDLLKTLPPKTEKKVETPTFETGEVYFDSEKEILLILVGQVYDEDLNPTEQYIVYPSTEMVEMATSEDIVYKHGGFTWFAITEPLYVDKKYLEDMLYLGKLDEVYIDILENQFTTGKVPCKYSGVTVIHGDSGFKQIRYRLDLLKKILRGGKYGIYKF